MAGGRVVSSTDQYIYLRSPIVRQRSATPRRSPMLLFIGILVHDAAAARVLGSALMTRPCRKPLRWRRNARLTAPRTLPIWLVGMAAACLVRARSSGWFHLAKDPSDP